MVEGETGQGETGYRMKTPFIQSDPKTFSRRRAALATILVNGGLLIVAYTFFCIAPRAHWPVWAEFTGFYALAAAIFMQLWRVALRARVRHSGLCQWTWWRYVDLSLAWTSFVVVPLLIFFAANAVWRFL
jgi:hypothetical protein